MKKFAIIALLLTAASLCSSARCFGEEEYLLPPMFLSGEVPPLVMLVMGRDHKMYYEAYNDASDLNGDGVLDISFNPAIDYYGYFDCYKCYTYDETNKIFNPTSVTSTKKCSGAWSGNFLNYVTMSRMDTMRKVLYGGSRSTDTAATSSAASQTVLQRVFIPQDAHSWGKSYESIAANGYDIRDYTTLALPQKPGLRHLFASTTLSKDGAPLLRVLNDSIYKIWEWVSIERPVAGDYCICGDPTNNNCTGSNKAVRCATSDGDLWEVVPYTAFVDKTTKTSTLRQRVYATRKCCSFGRDKSKCCNLKSNGQCQNSYPCFNNDAPTTPWDHTSFEQLISDYAKDENAFCGTPQVLATINGNSNPCGYDDYYLNIITGTIDIETEDDYTFAIDGDDAVELIVDNTTVADFYNEHGACNCKDHKGTIHLTAGAHTIQYRHVENAGNEKYVLYWKRNGVNSTIKDYEVRVKVCDPAVGLESNCSTYTDDSGNKNYKPTGLLQHYGEADRMYFGLITGTWVNNLQGGVVRKNIKSIKDEINAKTGKFENVDGIIKTIDKFKIVGFDYGSHSYATECGWIKHEPLSNEKCRNWGNPIGEMMYEGLRYFAGEKAPTGDFTYDTSADDDALGLPKPATWEDPFKDNTATGFKAYSYCSKPFMLVLSDINPSYDSDQMPGSAWTEFSGALKDTSGTAFNAKEGANTISDYETSKPTEYFIGDQLNVDYLGACTEKTDGKLGDIRGLCPEEPTKQGSYYAAAAAKFGKTHDLNPASNAQKLTTYAVAMSSPLPKLEIPVGSNTITLVPFAKTVGGNCDSQGCVDGSRNKFQPTNTIVDFYITTLLPTHGVFQINYEDVEQGADHDMDAIVEYEYQVVDSSNNPVSDSRQGSAVKITLSSKYAAGNFIQHMGYIISGTTQDGTYLEVRDFDTATSEDPDYFLDTPPGKLPNTGLSDTAWDDDAALPLSSVRTFYPDATGGDMVASLLNDPLWYAAKWGGFDDSNNNNRPDKQEEWDADNDSLPDTYFYVTNPLKLEEQLNKSFAAILQKSGSGTAVSVLATKGEGEGTILQAYFKQKVTDEPGINTLSWTGYLQALWIDAVGNLHEDTINDLAFKPAEDKIIEYFKDSTGDTMVHRYEVGADPYAKTGSPGTYSMEDLKPLWEGGLKLWKRNAADRVIYTSRDGATKLDFTVDNAALLKPYLNVVGGTSDFLGGADLQVRAKNLISFVRGMPDDATDPAYAYTGTPKLRRRTFQIGTESHVWKLGDIVYSTPVILSRPVESYHIVYDDTSYKNFYETYKNRETVAYVGGNDGMLHAFSFGKFDDSGDFGDNGTRRKFTAVAHSYNPSAGIGDELWAYVPRCQLPHLRMLAKDAYTGSNHLSFVDLKPKVLDAKIFPADNSTTPAAGAPFSWWA